MLENHVSVIMPFYNDEETLLDAIRGVVHQDYTNWELILICDGSYDGSLNIALNEARIDSRIKIIAMESNSGPAIARNAGISVAKGRYIGFCDADDIWLQNKLTVQIAVFRNTRCAISYSSYFKMLHDGTKTTRIVTAPEFVSEEMIVRSNYIGCSTALYDSKVLGKRFMPAIRKRQDYGLWLNIILDGHKAVGVIEPLIYYRIRSKSVSSNKILAAYYHWVVLSRCTDLALYKRFSLFLNYSFSGLRKFLI
jgi:teichuronic acid biosynthesis glycosyltransferase TuaG